MTDAATPKPEQRRPWTPAELALEWQCDESQVRKLVRAGKLKAFRVGTLIRILDSVKQEYEQSPCATINRAKPAFTHDQTANDPSTGSSSTAASGASSGKRVVELDAARWVRQTVR